MSQYDYKPKNYLIFTKIMNFWPGIYHGAQRATSLPTKNAISRCQSSTKLQTEMNANKKLFEGLFENPLKFPA